MIGAVIFVIILISCIARLLLENKNILNKNIRLDDEIYKLKNENKDLNDEVGKLKEENKQLFIEYIFQRNK